MTFTTRRLQLCRFENDTPPIQVVSLPSNRTIPSVASVWEWEDWLELVLDDDANEPNLHYVTCNDVFWLKCRRPMQPLGSVLGILEQQFTHNATTSNDRVNDCKVQWEAYVAVSTSASPADGANCNCVCEAPRQKWGDSKNDEGRSSADYCQKNMSSPGKYKLVWIDLRCVNLRLSTPASKVHFLRSLLGVDHAASPWRCDKPRAFCGPCEAADVAVLLLSDTNELENFRVSDACPSWYLHAICKVASINAPFEIPVDRSSTDSLLLYRRLSQRDNLTSCHPLTCQCAPAGCLWETYQVSPEEGQKGDDSEKETRYRLVAPPYIDPLVDYPPVRDLLNPENLKVMQQEALSISQHWTAWPEQQHYQVAGANLTPWKVFPLCHCFPAYDVNKRVWIARTSQAVPRTVKLLLKHLGNTLRTALFSRLDAEAILEAHTGWQDLANHVLRLHIPLIVPTGGLCGTWVDGCVETHEVGRAVCFDDSKTHRAFNYSAYERIVVILDLARPDSLPLGTAQGGHSEELDTFIAQMNLGT